MERRPLSLFANTPCDRSCDLAPHPRSRRARAVSISSDRGNVALDALWGLLLGSMALLSCAFLSSRVSSSATLITREINGRLAAAKTIAVVTGALRSLDRNRQEFAAIVVSGTSPLLPIGTRHPLVSISSASGPRADSDILTLIDLDNRYRGTVASATLSGSSVDATICGISHRIPSGAFKSYLLLSIEGARQVVGQVAPVNATCARLIGSSIQGVVSRDLSFTSRPLVFVPIDREYSLFVDRNANLRLASHTGSTILENQPISRGVDALTIQRQRRADGTRIFKLTVRPSVGREISRFIIPAQTQRNVWNEVLP